MMYNKLLVGILFIFTGIVLLFLLAGCSLLSTDRIRGLKANPPSENCRFRYAKLITNEPLGCYCELGARSEEGVPAIVVVRVPEHYCMRMIDPKYSKKRAYRVSND